MEGDESRRRSWGRYPPVAGVVLAIFIALAVLPSALTTPQSNPSTSLEYAPVAPGDEDSPPGGNVSSLGLGRSSTIGRAAGGGAGDGPPGPAGGVGKSPSTKRCVGTPPRQTEDPLSPPCVAFFQGDNFAATHQGVTAGEVRVLFYFDGGGGGLFVGPTSRGLEALPGDRFFDLAEPAPDNEFIHNRMLRLYQAYFNDRYQTYNRFVHFVVHYGKTAKTPESRRADAAEAMSRVKPFAVVNYSTNHFDVYLHDMVRRGVVAFVGSAGVAGAGAAGQPASFFASSPGMIWSYAASLEHRARVATSFLCRRIVGHPVSFSGNGDHGAPRRLAFLRTDNQARPDLLTYAAMLRKGVEGCGGRFVAEGTFPNPACGECGDSPQYAYDNVARFRTAGVTTVIWGGGFETRHSKAAAGTGWRPEWVVPGDGRSESTDINSLQESSAWRHARATTMHVRAGEPASRICFQAARDADPDVPERDLLYSGCNLYPDLRQVFTGVQVAGPRLRPSAIDQGFHAIPSVSSPDPQVPACFYDAGDYTCVKDAHAQWWDPSGRSPGSNDAGCWRSMEGGRRYIADRWPSSDVEASRSAFDQCNAQGATFT